MKGLKIIPRVSRTAK